MTASGGGILCRTERRIQSAIHLITVWWVTDSFKGLVGQVYWAISLHVAYYKGERTHVYGPRFSLNCIRLVILRSVLFRYAQVGVA